jgi:hypothetical protein
MYKKRKAQGLSFNVIIIAVLALIVLIVILSIFSKQTGKSVNTLESCTGRGGECKPKCDTNQLKYGDKDLCPNNNICCITFFDDKNDKT